MKRTENTTALKITYLAATNDKPGRYKITQLNSNKSVTVGSQYSMEPIEYFCSILENIELVRSFNLVLDNSQRNYFLINIDFLGDSFEDILTYFKK